MGYPKRLQKVFVKRCYCTTSFCDPRKFAARFEMDCKNCPISHAQRRRCHGHKKCLSKPANMSTCTAKKEEETVEFDFNKMPPLLRDRFIELSNSYEKSKLQQVSHGFNDQIRQKERLDVIEKMVIFKPHNMLKKGKFGKFGNGFYLDPLDKTHIGRIRNTLVNYQLVGIEVPDEWISKAVAQNVSFYLETVRMERCNLSAFEIHRICGFGAVRYLHLDKIVATTPLSMKAMALWLKNATRIWIDIKNMKFEPDWPIAFLDSSNKLNRVTIKNASFTMNTKDFDRFLQERVISTKNELDWVEQMKEEQIFDVGECLYRTQIESVVTLSFNEEEIEGSLKKTVLKKIDSLFAGFYKNVTKPEFQRFKLNEKFIVERMAPIKPKEFDQYPYPYPARTTKCDRYFYVRCADLGNDEAAKNESGAAIQVMNEAEVNQVKREMKKLQI